ncbi:MAG: hypothetical protein RSA79_03455 [Oscillospiraceae bacterium]
MLNIGEKITVRKDLQIGKKYGDRLFHFGMGLHIGEDVTITENDVTGEKLYKIKEDFGEHTWAEEMFALSNEE